MIDNTHASKTTSSENSYQKYIGVASINILAINPDNAKLRQYGWQIPEGAEEPKYSTKGDRNGKEVTSGRVRFLVQIKDLKDQPVIPIDFWVHSSYELNQAGDKCKIIDAYGRTAWATKEDIKAKRAPQYANGPASICVPYSMCHEGEEAFVGFLMKYLNITPYRIFDRQKNAYVDAKNPGRLTIDNWNALCEGNTKEIAEYIALQPDNCVKIILGIRTTDDNKTYQVFFNGGYIGNASFPDKTTNEYTQARKMIDRFFEDGKHAQYSFSASPVREWKEVASVVNDNAEAGLFEQPSNDEPESFNSNDNDDELPF